MTRKEVVAEFVPKAIHFFLEIQDLLIPRLKSFSQVPTLLIAYLKMDFKPLPPLFEMPNVRGRSATGF